MARSGEPVGTPGKGPLEPAMSRWEYGRGLDESTPCCKYRVFFNLQVIQITTHIKRFLKNRVKFKGTKTKWPIQKQTNLCIIASEYITC